MYTYRLSVLLHTHLQYKDPVMFPLVTWYTSCQLATRLFWTVVTPPTPWDTLKTLLSAT